MAECSCSQAGNVECDIAALQQCFERLYSSPPLIATTSSTHQSQQSHNQQNCHRSPLSYPLFPLQVWHLEFNFEFKNERLIIKSFFKVKRRWSETAAAEMSGESAENTVRRWSMPWEMRSRLKVPHLQDRSSRSTTPDSVWKSATMTSQDGLREAIQLLSCKPGKFGIKYNSNFTFSSEKVLYLFF